jgi:hypothetical protein
MIHARIFEPWPWEDSEMCHPIRPEDYETFTVAINGERRASSWRPIAMEIIREDEGRVLSHADAPWLGSHALILRPRAIEAMEPLLSNNGELLPLMCEGQKLCVFNALRVENALDEAASTVERFSSSGRIMRITRYVFRPNEIAGVDAFKIPNTRGGATFVSDAFVARWTNAGLRGLDFKQVWPPPEE